MSTSAPHPLPARLRGIEELRLRTDMYDAVIDEIDGRRIRIGDRWLVDWASCNYLGFDLDPDVIASITDQVRRWGTHPGWSRMLGNPRLYPQIEEKLTELLHADDTLLLPTISQIHESVIPILAAHGTLLVESDAHKTIYDGCVHARGLGARVHRFGARNLQQLDDLLRLAPPGPRLVCINGVDSMSGNVPDLAAYLAVCRARDAVLYVDDAHGFGIVGERRPDESSPYGWGGNCVVRHRGVSYDNVVLVSGFSKAYSSLLAFLAVPTPLKNHLKVAAAPYLYSGPSPIASLASALAGLEVNAVRGEAVRARLYRLTGRVLDHLRVLGVRTLNTDGTPIIELPIAVDRDLVEVARDLWRHDLYVTLAPYPGVPRDQVGFRILVTAAHTDEQVDELIDRLTELAGAGALATAVPEPRHPTTRDDAVSTLAAASTLGGRGGPEPGPTPPARELATKANNPPNVRLSQESATSPAVEPSAALLGQLADSQPQNSPHDSDTLATASSENVTTRAVLSPRRIAARAARTFADGLGSVFGGFVARPPTREPLDWERLEATLLQHYADLGEPPSKASTPGSTEGR